MKHRKIKQQEYYYKYSNIVDSTQKKRIDNILPVKYSEDKILNRLNNTFNNLEFNELLIVLKELPEGTPRPRFRVINRRNCIAAAIANPSFVHVYQPNAATDYMFMKQLVEEDLELLGESIIHTPCIMTINAYFKTPSYYTTEERLLAECGLDWCIKKPDWDNMGKKYSDMMNTNIWIDDSLVISGTVNKFYSIYPRIEIRIQYLNALPNYKQYKSIITRKDVVNTNIPYIDNFGNKIP